MRRLGQWALHYPRTALALFLLLSYWPLSFGLASLKNDALTYFLPFRHALSESFAQGVLPLWSPYLYTGLPVHADMQSGMWNPVAMLLALLFRYNMTVLTAEVLLYLIFGAWGFYALGRHLRWTVAGAFGLAAAYSLQGFFGDSASFVPWVAAGAWLPWVLLGWKKATEYPSIKNTARLGLFAFLLLTCGYPSFFIITAYGLLALTLYLCFHRAYRRRLPALLAALAGAGGLTLLLSLPALISYWEFLPYYQRGSGISRSEAMLNSFSIRSLLSLAVPPSAYPLETGNDISSRNGSVALLLLPLAVLGVKSGGWRERTIALIVLLCFFLSLGAATPLRGWAWDLLPGWNVFRHPATLRLFTATGLLLLAGTGLRLEEVRHQGGWLQRTEKFLLLILAGLWLSALLRGGGAELFTAMRTAAGGSGRAILKAFYGEVTPAGWLLLLLPLQALLVRWTALRLKSGASHPLLPPLLVQLFLCSSLSFPYTLISQQRPGEVNRSIRSWASEPPLAAARLPLRLEAEDSVRHPLGYPPFYSRRITLQDAFISPTIPAAYGALIRDTALVKDLNGAPLAGGSEGTAVRILTVTPNRFVFDVRSLKADTLRFRQQFHHHWVASVNMGMGTILHSEKAFMAVPLRAGHSIVEFRYRPRAVLQAAWLSAVLLILLLIFLSYPLHVQKARH